MASNFEKKFGRYAISNLSLYLIIGYIIGYVTKTVFPTLAMQLTLEPAFIMRGQVWRLFTWLLIPPETSNLFFVAIMLLFYYSIGRTLESVWGTYKYNVYLFSGMIYTLVGAFILYFVMSFIMGAPVTGFGSLFTTYYVNMSIFLAYAATFPNMQVLLMFIIPIKVKYLGIIYGVFLVVSCLEMLAYDSVYGGMMAVAVFCSLLNFLMYFLKTKGLFSLTKEQSKMRSNFRAQTRTAAYEVTRHKCAICGRTEETHPDLDFRFCTKCKGNYEYCQDHLFTHKHIEG